MTREKPMDGPAASPGRRSAATVRSSSLSPSGLMVSWIKAALSRLRDSTSSLCWSDRLSSLIPGKMSDLYRFL